jgi:hypothetical protein
LQKEFVGIWPQGNGVDGTDAVLQTVDEVLSFYPGGDVVYAIAQQGDVTGVICPTIGF